MLVEAALHVLALGFQVAELKFQAVEGGVERGSGARAEPKSGEEDSQNNSG